MVTARQHFFVIPIPLRCPSNIAWCTVGPLSQIILSPPKGAERALPCWCGPIAGSPKARRGWTLLLSGGRTSSPVEDPLYLAFESVNICRFEGETRSENWVHKGDNPNGGIVPSTLNQV